MFAVPPEDISSTHFIPLQSNSKLHSHPDPDPNPPFIGIYHHLVNDQVTNPLSSFSLSLSLSERTNDQAFQLMDADKDGIIGKNDLRAAFDSVGKIANDKELDQMLGEASGPINFTQLLTLFANRMATSGANDEDDVVIAAFKTFDNDGLIDGDKFREMLMNFGDKFTMKEVDDAYDQMVIDDKNQIDTGALIEMLTGKGEEEEEEAA